MKRFVGTLGVAVAVLMGVSAPASAAHANPHPKKSKKKCKAGRTFQKGKCRRVSVVPPALPGPRGPRSLVRATLISDGPASLWLQVTGVQGRAGYFPSEGGTLNEIPNAHYSGGANPYGPGTESFTDDLFYGDYGSIWVPSPGNRGFSFTRCYGGTDATGPSHVSFTTVDRNGIVQQASWTIPPASGPQVTGCATYQ